MIEGLAGAYSATGGAWQAGPARVYDRLAGVLVDRSPASLEGRHVLDVGAGTGALTRAALAAGAARVTAVDAAFGMLAHDAAARPPAVVGDVARLPLAPGSCGAAVAAFSLNHLTDPAAGLREMARVTAPGGVVLGSAYAADDSHPVKAAVEAVLAELGWVPEPWHDAMRTAAVPLLATTDGCRAALDAAGLRRGAFVEAVRVPFDELDAGDLVAWRFGMAQHAGFVASLTEAGRHEAATAAVERLGDAPPPLVRSILVFGALSP